MKRHQCKSNGCLETTEVADSDFQATSRMDTSVPNAGRLCRQDGRLYRFLGTHLIGEPNEHGMVKVGPDVSEPLEPPPVGGSQSCEHGETVWLDDDADNSAITGPKMTTTQVVSKSVAESKNNVLQLVSPKVKRNVRHRMPSPKLSGPLIKDKSLSVFDKALSPLFALWQKGMDDGDPLQSESARCGLTCSIAKTWPELTPSEVAKTVNRAAKRYKLRHSWPVVKSSEVTAPSRIGPLSKAAIMRLRSKKLPPPHCSR